MKSKEQELAAWETFQEQWNSASREEILRRLHGTQHQATFYAHQIDAFEKQTKLLEDQLAYARRLIELVVQGEFSEHHAQIFLNQVLGEKTSWGEPDHGAQEPEA